VRDLQLNELPEPLTLESVYLSFGKYQDLEILRWAEHICKNYSPSKPEISKLPMLKGAVAFTVF